jgi:thiol:disulfide interchange protein DsbD
MKKIIVLMFMLCSFFTLKSQTQNPVTWAATYKSISATEGEIIITATIEKGWHTYSQRESDAGPIPTSFKFDASKNYQLVGKTEESNSHEEFVKAFEAKIFVFKDKAEFRQKVKVTTAGKLDIAFKADFMCCNDAMCLPPKTVNLSVKVK